MSSTQESFDEARNGLDSPALSNRYRDHQLLASGATGSVWKAFDAHLNRIVAIKRITADASRKNRINAEVKLMVFLNHPAILRLLDIVQDKKFVYVIQPFCERGTLEQWIKDHAPDYRKRTRTFMQILSAVKYLHMQKWIHGDIKSANVLIDDRENPFLTDFGNATFLEKDSQYAASQDGSWVGTVGYMAPELLRHESVPTIASDIYALGILLYEILAGFKPFSDDLNAAVQATLQSKLPKLKVPELTSLADYNWVIKRATAPEPSNRYRSIAEFAADVQNLERNLPLFTQPPSLINQVIKWSQREPLIARLLAAVSSLAVIGLVVTLVAWKSSSSSLADIQQERDKLNLASNDVKETQLELAALIEEARVATEEAKKKEAETLAAIEAISAIDSQSRQEILKNDKLTLANDAALKQSIKQWMSIIESVNQVNQSKRTPAMLAQAQDAHSKLREWVQQNYPKTFAPSATLDIESKEFKAFSRVAFTLFDSPSPAVMDETLRFLESESIDWKSLLRRMSDSSTDRKDWKTKTKLATLMLYWGSSEIAVEMLNSSTDENAEQRTAFVEQFRYWPVDSANIARCIDSTQDPFLRSGICKALQRLERPEATSLEAWENSFDKWSEETNDVNVCNAIRAVMDEWKLDLPPRIASMVLNEPGRIRQSATGGKFVRIPAGEYKTRERSQEGVTRQINAFWLSEKEITWGQFRQMVNDPEYLAERNKPESGLPPLPLPALPRASQDQYPAVVRWEFAVEFCNWLSRRDGLTEAYARSGDFYSDSDKKLSPIWLPTAYGNGYRLVDSHAWSYAALAGTQGNYCFGDDAYKLSEFAFFGGNSPGKIPQRVGLKKSNEWGLFDMHGNVPEWTEPDVIPLRSLRMGGGASSGAEDCSVVRPEAPSNFSELAGVRLAVPAFGQKDILVPQSSDIIVPKFVPQEMATNPRIETNAQIFWNSTMLSPSYYGEGGTICDIDADGNMDIVAGPLIYFGPDFRSPVFIRQSLPLQPLAESEFGTVFDHDVDSDGHLDLIVVGGRNTRPLWFRNPGKNQCRSGNWEQYTIAEPMENDAATFADFTGDGKPELVFVLNNRFGYAEIPRNPTMSWPFTPVSSELSEAQLVAGIGIGDLNHDGRADLISNNAWWEQPANPSAIDWMKHQVWFGLRGNVPICTADMDRDGRVDIVSPLSVNDWGSAVFKNGSSATIPRWIRFNIESANQKSKGWLGVTSMRAMQIVDVDRDGRPDVVTGHRFLEKTTSGEKNRPVLLAWFQNVKTKEGLGFIPHVITTATGTGKQIAVRDINNDGRVDVLSVSKLGIFILTQSDQPSLVTPSDELRDQIDSVAKKVVKINDSLGGFRPAWTDTEPMNLDFETGDLQDWTSEGFTFLRPLTIEPTQKERALLLGDKFSGKYFFGTAELLGENVTGTLTSRPFLISFQWISYSFSGIGGEEVTMEILDHPSQKVLHKQSVQNSESFKRFAVDGKNWLGKSIRIRLSDKTKEGHFNFDDVRIHYYKPSDADLSTFDPNQTEIEKLEAKLASLNGKYDFGIHNQLRHLYGGRNPAKSTYHLETILENQVMEPYMLKILGNHRKTTEQQTESLVENAKKNETNQVIVAACYLQAARLTEVAEQKIQWLEMVLATTSEKAKPYRNLAESMRKELINDKSKYP